MSGIFTATEKEVFGQPGIELSFKRNDHDRQPWLITLTIQTRLNGYRRFPAAYQFLEEGEERPWPIIRVIVAPGVSLAIQNIPDSYIVGPETPALEFFRVQDPELVPPMAHDINPLGFAGQEELNPPMLVPPPDMPDLYPENYFRIERLPSEVIIQHPFTRTTLQIRVPEFTRDPRNPADAQTRFCFEFNPQGVLGNADQPLLRIVKTPSVRLVVAAEFVSLRAQTDLRRSLVFYQVFEVDNINAVPPQGAEIIPETGWRELRAFDRIRPLEEEVLTRDRMVHVRLERHHHRPRGDGLPARYRQGERRPPCGPLSHATHAKGAYAPVRGRSRPFARARHPGGHAIARPPRTCRCTWCTVWPAWDPVFATRR